MLNQGYQTLLLPFRDGHVIARYRRSSARQRDGLPMFLFATACREDARIWHELIRGNRLCPPSTNPNEPLDGLDADLPVMSLDLRMHGPTGADSDLYSHAELAEFLATFVVEMGLHDIVLVARDFGRECCCRAAAALPDRVSGLVLVSSSVFGFGGGEEEMSRWVDRSCAGSASILLNGDALREDIGWSLAVAEGSRSLRARRCRLRRVMGDLQEIAAFYLAAAGPAAAAGEADRARKRLDRLERADLAPVLCSLRQPALLVWSEEDEWFRLVAQANRFDELIPGAQRAVLRGKSALAPVEQRQAVVALMQKWAGPQRAVHPWSPDRWFVQNSSDRCIFRWR